MLGSLGSDIRLLWVLSSTLVPVWVWIVLGLKFKREREREEENPS